MHAQPDKQSSVTLLIRSEFANPFKYEARVFLAHNDLQATAPSKQFHGVYPKQRLWTLKAPNKTNQLKFVENVHVSIITWSYEEVWSIRPEGKEQRRRGKQQRSEKPVSIYR